jgi:hypothetical protein
VVSFRERRFSGIIYWIKIRTLPDGTEKITGDAGLARSMKGTAFTRNNPAVHRPATSAEWDTAN